MRMTLVYARIADRTVADQYYAAANRIDTMYETPLTTSPAYGPKPGGQLTARLRYLVCVMGGTRLGRSGVKTDHVAFGVGDDRDGAVFADRELRPHDYAAGRRHPSLFHRAVVAREVDH